jgi:hypothetical protein
VNRIRELDERTTAMTTLAEDYNYVIGGDPDRDTGPTIVGTAAEIDPCEENDSTSCFYCTGPETD